MIEDSFSLSRFPKSAKFEASESLQRLTIKFQDSCVQWMHSGALHRNFAMFGNFGDGKNYELSVAKKNTSTECDHLFFFFNEFLKLKNKHADVFNALNKKADLYFQ